MPGWTAILFDLDDTLYAEREFVKSGFREVSRLVAESTGIAAEQAYRQLMEIFDRGPRDRVFDAWLARHDIQQPGLLDEMITRYRHHVPTIRLRPGMLELLDTIRRTGKLGIVTDGLLATQQRKVAALELAPRFESIVYSDQWGRAFWKPHVRPFQEALAQLQTLGEQAVYIGDNPWKDFAPCRTLGITSIWLRMPDGIYQDREPPSPADRPDRVVQSVAELSAILAGHG